MSRFTYTQEHLDFLEKNYQTMMARDLTKAFNKHFGLNRTHVAIQSVLSRKRIKPKRGSLYAPEKLFTTEQASFICEKYKTLPREPLTKALNKKFGTSFTQGQVEGFLVRNKITCNRTGYFTKGQKPWNKGTTGLTSTNRTSFKSGHVPFNLRPVGSERIDTDGYTLIKIDKTNPNTGYRGLWVFKHRYLWEQRHGKIPEDMTLIFKDGNPGNLNLNNLELVTRVELAALNRVYKYRSMPEELKFVVLTAAKLTARVWELNEELKEERL